MRNKPTDEEQVLFEDLTSGMAGNLLLMPIEFNGVETSAIFAFETAEPIEEDGKKTILLHPVVILFNDDMKDMIKMPEGFDEFNLPASFLGEDDDELDHLFRNDDDLAD